jgi:hypothetical protein
MSFIAGAWEEAKLLRIAFAFEQATKTRRAPAFLATASLGSEGARNSRAVSGFRGVT